MLYLLIFISFFIHMITFIYLKTVNNRVLSSEELLQKQAEQKKEIEALLAVYLLEIREENEKLVETLQQPVEQSKKQPQAFKTDRSEALYNKDDNNNLANKADEKQLLNEQEMDYQPPKIEEVEGSFKPSFQAKVLSLYDKGNTVETIARKLNCGKTEVELLVKFQQKNK
ncbi:DUF6115 domain-containing protein [Paraliobacillus sp. JSM ZJ581]|uniref:DUF6115 domain-containing protein n=1 Tax=Paraliobacillus sp. JSM ZJ581 TaxID=3342118 RepID=UPI0035A84892